MFYCQDWESGKQESLHTDNEEDAERILNAKNEALRMPGVNLQIARAYLHASDAEYITRTWAEVFEAIIATKTGSSKDRWETAFKDPAYQELKKTVVTNSTASLL